MSNRINAILNEDGTKEMLFWELPREIPWALMYWSEWVEDDELERLIYWSMEYVISRVDEILDL